MEHRHTRGPWHLSEQNEPAGVWINAQFDDCDGGRITGSVGRAYSHLYMSPEECEANARLIAAAPDLLDAAARLIEDWDDGQPPHVDPMAWRKLRAAVAKATGQGECDD